jgi:thiol-disulfide isomerase/thioredoxin
MIRRACLPGIVALFLAAPLPAQAMVSIGAYPPPINVWTTTGQNVTFANYKGHVLIIDFFATWCKPCRVSIPHLVELNNKYGKKGLQVLGMSLDEGGEKAVKAFIVDKKINYPVAMANEEIFNDFGLRSLPTLFVFNKKGVIVERFFGYNDEIAKSMEALIIKLLAEK